MSLTISHLAHHVVAIADGDYQIPEELCVDAGSQVTVKMDAASGTLSAFTGTIDGDASFLMYEGESLQLVFDGTNWHAI